MSCTVPGPDGPLRSEVPGTLGGSSWDRICGTLTCKAAVNALPDGFAGIRVFFADEATGDACGRSRCHSCSCPAWTAWKDGRDAGPAV